MSTKSKKRRQQQKIKARRKKNAGYDILRSRAKGIFGNNVAFRNSNQEKMSEILLDYADPLLETTDDEDNYRSALYFAIMGWNLALMPDNKRTEMLDDLVKKLEQDGGTSPSETRSMLEWLINRKRKLFPNTNRFIADFQITGTGNNERLIVLSSLTEDG
jgi:hypothetical protein